MQFKEQVITPKQAATWLAQLNEGIEDGVCQQRKPSKWHVEEMAADIVRDSFGLTHQAIAFNEQGHLIDGRQRLMAIVRANKPLKLAVATNVPSAHQNGVLINTLDLIDTHRPRTLQQSWGQIQRLKNGTLMARVVRALCDLSTQAYCRISKSQATAVRELMFQEIADIILATGQGQKERKQWFLAPLSLYATTDRESALDFATRFCTMEKISSGSPIQILRFWTANHAGHSGGERATAMRVVCNALYFHHQNQKIQSLSGDEDGLEWLLHLTRKFSRKIREIAKPPELHPGKEKTA